MPRQRFDETLLIGVGGGKGGVGKSMVCSNIAIHYAQSGLNVILIDLDFGAANLHTIFGLRPNTKGLGEYLTTPRSKLNDYLINTKVENLQLIPGSGFVPEMANLKYFQKTKLVKHIKEIECDVVLLDLGAGSSHNVTDFFSMVHSGVVVSTPEPTAVINAYEFLKNVMYRILHRMFRKQESLAEILKLFSLPESAGGIATVAALLEAVEKKNPWMAETLREVCEDVDFHIVLNQARKAEEAQLGEKLHDITLKHLALDLHYSGVIFHNEEVSTSVLTMSPILLEKPHSITSTTLKRIANRVLLGIVKKHIAQKPLESFQKQVQQVMAQAYRDYRENSLLQKHLQRSAQRSSS